MTLALLHTVYLYVLLRRSDRHLALRQRGVTVHFEGVGSKQRKRAPPAKGGSKRAGVRSVTVRRLPSLVTGFGPMPPVYVDGSAAHGNSGVGVWYGKGHRLNLAGKLAAASDNNFAELAAVYFTLLRHPINKRLTIHTDSMFVLHRVNGLLMPLGSAQAGGGRAGTGALLRAVEWMLLMRRAPTTLRKVAAHGGHACNDTADALAALGAAGKGDFGGQAMWVPEDTSGLWERWLGRGCSAAVQWVRFLCNVHSDAAAATCMRRLQPLDSHMEVTDCVALDCEMVGVGPGGVESQLARVGLVNDSGNVLLECWVAPDAPVTDYRTRFSGVREADLVGACSSDHVRATVRGLLRGRVLVGHALANDLAVLQQHEHELELGDVRDTAAYLPLCNARGKPRKLKHLAKEVLGASIQGGEHSPVEDARAALYIYLQLAHQWEASLR